MWTCVLVILVTIQIYSCKPSYRDYIPNGYNVPNPCVSPGVWNAVGHYNPFHHTLIKNKFGRDFTSASNFWSLSLCRMDSDRDNKTNGEELGDPNCIWFEGQTPSHTPMSHPGICEPVGDPNCLRQQGFTCDQMENSPHLKP
ncbi:temptin-like [Mytilus trossulus]|uniref:temptin-like n=1 Tax=Mytilus trossulus TaxID=6551 RepID=UPI003004365C